MEFRISHLTSKTEIFTLYHTQILRLSSRLVYHAVWEVRASLFDSVLQPRIDFWLWWLPWWLIIFPPQMTMGQWSLSWILWYFCPKGPPIPREVPPDETWARSCLDLCSLGNPFYVAGSPVKSQPHRWEISVNSMSQSQEKKNVQCLRKPLKNYMYYIYIIHI